MGHQRAAMDAILYIRANCHIWFTGLPPCNPSLLFEFGVEL